MERIVKMIEEINEKVDTVFEEINEKVDTVLEVKAETNEKLDFVTEKLDEILESPCDETPDQKPVERKLDKLGRITLPIHMRRNLEIGEEDAVLVYTSGNKIIIEKAENS